MGGGWVDWGGEGHGCVEGCPIHASTCMCTHTHKHTHTHTHMHIHVVNMINMNASMGQPFAISIHVYMSVHACASMHMHVHMCGDTTMPPDTPTHLSLPRAAGSPKHQNSINLELIKIF